MRDEKGLSPDAGRGADAGLRKNLLTPSPPRAQNPYSRRGKVQLGMDWKAGIGLGLWGITR